jgi:hypothetical protein
LSCTAWFLSRADGSYGNGVLTENPAEPHKNYLHFSTTMLHEPEYTNGTEYCDNNGKSNESQPAAENASSL